MHLAPAGDRALLVDLGDVTAEQLHAANARVREVPGVVKSIPGHSSLYVIFDSSPDHDAVASALQTTDTWHPKPGTTHSVPVQFDGENLDELLALTRQSREEFLARVANVRLTARYLGFRGGFAYLDGWPREWAMPRRPTSRPVQRGSFAIAGNVAAFYPIDSPGGWNVLGRTNVDLENAIAPGDVIEIVLWSGGLSARRFDRRAESLPLHKDAEVVGPTLAIWTSNPFDDIAAAIANHAVDNDASAPLFECPLAGPKLRFTRDAVIAWCTPDLRVTVERVKKGDERAFGRVTGGLRAYLAIGEREGIVASVTRGDRHVIRAMPGPHDVGLGDVECEVTPQLDRVGIRMRPLRALGVEVPADLRSVGMQVGTVQLHPDGSLVAMGPDHPVTGGYLQPMTVISSERWKLAQLAPGERVTLTMERRLAERTHFTNE